VSQLHISKVAVGCTTLEALRRRQAARAAFGAVPIVTRFRPKRADELVGGSIFWILQHRITARQTILGFAEQETDRRTIIRLDPELVPVGRFPNALTRDGATFREATRPSILAMATTPRICRRRFSRR
jgi:hypothetical protein